MAVPQLKLAEPQVEMQTTPRQLKVDDNYILMHAKELSESLHQQRLALYPPVAQKSLRKFTSGEAAKLIGVDDGYLRQLALDGKGPEAETLPNGRRMYSLDDINALRAYLDENARGGRRYLKHRSGKEHLQIISCVNFKGGSAVFHEYAVKEARPVSPPARQLRATPGGRSQYGLTLGRVLGPQA